MATTVWKGHLTFGLISMPVRMSTAARGERISFNQLHKECHSRLKQPLFCPVCNRNVERSEIVKGYEYEKDQYVLFNEEELDKIEPSSARVMQILEFVNLDEMDPLYFDSSYYLTPEDAGVKAYQLLMKAMEESGYGAIAKLTMHQREHIVIVRPGTKGMTLHTMFYSNEIRAAESVPTDKIELKEQEKKLARQLIESLAAPFEPQRYRDEYQENVRAMIAAKLKGQEVTEVAQPHMAPVIDLMEALKKSLAEKQAPAAAAAPAAPATDRFTPEETQRIVGLTGKQLDYWDRLRLVSPRKDQGSRFYDFGDLISLRTVKQLIEKGVPANRLRRALAALRERLAQVQAPLAELRVLSDGKDIVVERGGARLEPLSGQFVLNFDIGELDERVRVMEGRNADEWLATALAYEAEGKTRAQAIEAYDRALCVDPQRLEVLINCGTLCYEDGNLEKASE